MNHVYIRYMHIKLVSMSRISNYILFYYISFVLSQNSKRGDGSHVSWSLMCEIIFTKFLSKFTGKIKFNWWFFLFFFFRWPLLPKPLEKFNTLDLTDNLWIMCQRVQVSAFLKVIFIDSKRVQRETFFAHALIFHFIFL